MITRRHDGVVGWVLNIKSNYFSVRDICPQLFSAQPYCQILLHQQLGLIVQTVRPTTWTGLGLSLDGL